MRKICTGDPRGRPPVKIELWQSKNQTTMTKTTLKDLARILDLSESTISRALRDHPRISVETRRRVKELAERMDYVPNQLAVNLLQQRTNTIGVIVPRIGYHLYATAISGMEAEAEKEGFNIVICQSLESYNREQVIVRELLHARTAGFIVSIASKTADFECFPRFFPYHSMSILIKKPPKSAVFYQFLS